MSFSIKPRKRTSPPQTTANNHQPTSPFLTLPWEIREHILLLVLRPVHRVIHSHSRQPWVTDIYRHKTHPSPPILSVCHQLHDESQQIICTRAKLVIYPQADTFPQLQYLHIRRLVRHLSVAIPLLEQDSRIPTRRKRAMTLLGCAPEKLAVKLTSIFPAVQTISLTICPMLSRSLPISAYMGGRWNYELRDLLRQDLFIKKTKHVRIQLTEKVSDLILELIQTYNDARGGGDGAGSVAASGVLARAKLREILHMKLGHIDELPGLKVLEIYFTTMLSKTSHNRPIIWAMHTGEGGADPGPNNPNTTSASQAMVTRQLHMERRKMDHIHETLKEIIPSLSTGGKLRLFRMLYWRGSVTVEKINLESEVDEEVKKLLKHRTIVGSPNVMCNDVEMDLMSLRSRD